jgi:four helix bundle protein
MTRSAEEFQKRTRDFAIRVIKLVNQLPSTKASDVIGKQILRAATSVGANYRAACRARSAAEFRAKLGIVEEEGDECCYWLDLLSEAEIIPKHLLVDLQKEANEITAMIVASIRTSKEQNKR